MLHALTILPRRAKQGIILLVDALVVLPAVWITNLLHGSSGQDAFLHGTAMIVAIMVSSGLIASALGVHRIQLKSYEFRGVLMTGLHAVCTAIGAGILTEVAGRGPEIGTLVNFALIYALMCAGARVAMLRILLGIYRHGQKVTRVMIYGAGRTGQQLVAALQTDDRIVPMAFIDDNPSLHGSMVGGLRVYAPLMLPKLIVEKQVDRVLLAMPTAARAQIARISRRLEDMGVEVQTLPSFAELAGSGGALLMQLESVTPDRFLGRKPMDSHLTGHQDSYAGAVVMVTGAGGSIGSELCRQLLAARPRKLVLLELSEVALYNIDQELQTLAQNIGVEIVPALGSVADTALLRKLLTTHGVEVILHAAAYKHVPLVEANPVAGFANNVIGTQVLAQSALDCGVRKFILVSTDKAVRPSNMMGASKRLAEMIVQDLASRNTKPEDTVFSMVRFGNVLGSSGSVIPLFQDQISKGGPITLTHPDVTRYFMTIPEASRLVLLAGSFAKSGDLFVLDMGEPVSIHALARQMIEAHGYRVRDAENPDGDIEIQLTGLRPGEKLHEELLISEGHLTTIHPKILQAREQHLSQIEVAACLKAIRTALVEADGDSLRQIVGRFVDVGEDFLRYNPQVAQAAGAPAPQAKTPPAAQTKLS